MVVPSPTGATGGAPRIATGASFADLDRTADGVVDGSSGRGSGRAGEGVGDAQVGQGRDSGELRPGGTHAWGTVGIGEPVLTRAAESPSGSLMEDWDQDQDPGRENVPETAAAGPRSGLGLGAESRSGSFRIGDSLGDLDALLAHVKGGPNG